MYNYFSLIKYAIIIEVDLDIPAKQCTSTFVFCKLFIINPTASSKYYEISSSG